MELILDLGNTMVKAAVMDNGQILDMKCECRMPTGWIDKVRDRYPIDASIWCSTRRTDAGMDGYLSSLSPYSIRFLPGVTPIPIENMYDNRFQLGADRLALAVGASKILPGKNCLIFDFGTALTVDYLTADKKFMGGCISPGLRMRLLSLHEHTAALPLIEPGALGGKADAIPSNTYDAISQGVYRSMLYEVQGHIDHHPEAEIIFSGYDAKFFAKQFNFTIFAESDTLLLNGLDAILWYCRQGDGVFKQ